MFSMRRRFLVLTVAASVFLTVAGCGDKNLILRVDLLSFLDPGVTQGHYGPIPPGIADSVTISDITVNLVPGISSVTTVESADIEIEAQVANVTGSGSGQLRVYFSDGATDPLTTSPVVLPVTLAPATTDTLSVTVAGDPRIAALFTGDRLRMALRVALASGAGPDSLEGDFQLTKLRAVVTAGQAVFE